MRPTRNDSVYISEVLRKTNKQGGIEDIEIIKLYQRRSEATITEAALKYSNYCTCIAKNILKVTVDAEECVNDIYMIAWNVIPPA